MEEISIDISDVSRLLCKAGYHKYDMRKMTMKYIGEAPGNLYDYNVQNECIHCGHRFSENIYIPKPVWVNEAICINVSDGKRHKERENGKNV